MSTNVLSLASLSPGRDLEAYIQTINAFPVLSAEDERALAERFYYEQDLEAARELVLCHMRFVVHLARSYAGYGLSQADLIQEGNIGLMKAVRRFDPEVGVRLVSFAVHWIRAEMHEFILRNWRIVKVATTKAQRKLFFNLRSRKNKIGWLNDAETRAIAHDLGVPPATVTQMEGRLSSRDLAFDGYPNDDADEAPPALRSISRIRHPIPPTSLSKKMPRGWLRSTSRMPSGPWTDAVGTSSNRAGCATTR